MTRRRSQGCSEKDWELCTHSSRDFVPYMLMRVRNMKKDRLIILFTSVRTRSNSVASAPERCCERDLYCGRSPAGACLGTQFRCPFCFKSFASAGVQTSGMVGQRK